MQKIMFNDRCGLTQAVLEGRKTQTRRIVPEGTPLGNFDETAKCARYRVGEEVAVAQCYGNCGTWFFPVAEYGHMAGYTNKMFVCADLMPHRIKITNIRVEPLQDISEEDCLKEGVMTIGNYKYGVYGIWDKSYKKGNAYVAFDTAKQAFAALINRTCGKGTWERNPWVFVYDFELVK